MKRKKRLRTAPTASVRANRPKGSTATAARPLALSTIAVHGTSALISACLIVRDEEANLARCLSSLQGAVDEIIVVDTGSTDNTVAVAQAAGAGVFHFTWCDDFSAARNESLRHATGDWLLWIDADEELVLAQPDALRRLCALAPASSFGFLATVRCPADEQGLTGTVADQWRIFPNHRGLSFRGRIHEQLSLAGGNNHPAAASQAAVSVYHHGYIPAGDVIARKGERNRRLLQQQLAEDPEVPWHHFYLGRQYVWEEQFQLALPSLEHAIDLWFAQGQPPSGYTHSMFSTAALAASKLEFYDRVLQIEQRAPIEVQSCELVYIAGTAYWHLGRPQEAQERLDRAWRDPSLRKTSGIDPSTATWRPLMALAYIYEAGNELGKARAALEKALAHAPDRPDIIESLALLAGKMERPRDGLRWARRLLALGNEAERSRAEQLIETYESWLESEASRRRPQRISACLIVKNEEANLPRILTSLQGAVDEVIVVDTGSTDDSVAIAQSFGAQVRHFEWCDDFAAARNESLRYATGDWIIWVDGDDELVESEPGALKRLCQSAHPSVAGYWIDCHSLRTADGQVANVIHQWRLFRASRGIRFHGRIHEYLSPTNKTVPVNIMPQDAAIVRHWGYIPREGLVEQKGERNLRLLNLAVAEEPNNPYHYFNIGKQYTWQDDPVTALSHLERAIQLWNEQGRPNVAYLGPMFTFAVHAAVNTGAFEKALEFEASMPAATISSEILCEAAIACVQLRRVDEAEARLQRAWSDPSVRNSIERDPTTSTWKPLLFLADLHLQLGHREKAYDWAKKAVEFLPPKPEILLEWAKLADRCGEPDEAARWLRQLLESEHESSKPKARRVLLDIAARRNDGAGMLEALAGPVDGLSDLEALQLGARALAMAVGGKDAPEPIDVTLERPERGALTPPSPTAVGEARKTGQIISTTSALGTQHPALSPQSSALSTQHSALISACLIVKNEEANLERCLRSLENAVDEIIVIDTGSTDQTAAIARAHGARVFTFPWNDNFSAARNESLGKATSSHILWIDADEELVEREPGALQRLCTELPPEFDGYWVRCDSLGSNQGDIRTSARQWRVLRREPKAVFEGRIHEQLRLPEGRQPRLAEQQSVHVRHWGYIPRGDTLARKSERNHRLLRLAIADAPDDPQRHFNLGLQHSAEGNFAMAFEVMGHAIDLWKAAGRLDAAYVPGMFSIAALAALQLSRHSEALEIEALVPLRYVSSDLLCYMGIVYWRLGRLPEAIERLERAGNDPTIVPAQLHDQSTSTWRPPLLLAQIYEQMGQLERARDCARRALALAPSNTEVVQLAGSLLDHPPIRLAPRAGCASLPSNDRVTASWTAIL